MTDPRELARRNAEFAADGFSADLTINPSGNMMVVGCVAPRVDPGHVLGLDNGEAATHRPGDWNLVILHHTGCGMTDLAPFPELLAEYFEISLGELDPKSVSDRVGSVRVDVDVVLQTIHTPAFLVSGLVYDVGSGSTTRKIAPRRLLAEGPRWSPLRRCRDATAPE